MDRKKTRDKLKTKLLKGNSWYDSNGTLKICMNDALKDLSLDNINVHASVSVLGRWIVTI